MSLYFLVLVLQFLGPLGYVLAAEASQKRELTNCFKGWRQCLLFMEIDQILMMCRLKVVPSL
jgi:hypothetical protein